MVRWLCKEHHERWHMKLDPMKHVVIDEPLAEVKRLKEEAMTVQKEIMELRNRYRDLLAKASSMEIKAWNEVVEKAHPMFQEFLKTA